MTTHKTRFPTWGYCEPNEDWIKAHIEAAFHAGYDAGWDLSHAHASGCKTECDSQTSYIEYIRKLTP